MNVEFMLIRAVLLSCLFLPLKLLAVPVSFDFTSSDASTPPSPMHFNAQGIQLSVWGTLDSDESDFATLYQDEYGLGLISGSRDNKEIDNFGPDEVLHLLFDAPVRLLGLGLSQIGSNDQLSLSVDATEVFSGDIIGGDDGDDLDVSRMDFSGDQLFGRFFQLQPLGTYAEFSLQDISVEVASVPAPSAVALLIPGLMGLRFLRRKRLSAPALPGVA